MSENDPKTVVLWEKLERHKAESWSLSSRIWLSTGGSYSFPISALTHSYRLSILNSSLYHLTLTEVRSPKWSSLDWKQAGRSVFFLESLGDIVFTRFFQLLKATHIPWLVAYSSIFKDSNDHWSISPITTFLVFHSFVSLCQFFF